jgi:hypothetical protein
MKECYFCYGDELGSDNPCVNPCDCRGTCGSIHLDCLRELIKVGEQSCRVCKKFYDLRAYETCHDRIMRLVKQQPDILEYIEQDHELCLAAVKNCKQSIVFYRLLKIIRPEFITIEIYETIFESFAPWNYLAEILSIIPGSEELYTRILRKNPLGIKAMKPEFLTQPMIDELIDKAPCVMAWVPQKFQTSAHLEKYMDRCIAGLRNEECMKAVVFTTFENLRDKYFEHVRPDLLTTTVLSLFENAYKIIKSELINIDSEEKCILCIEQDIGFERVKVDPKLLTPSICRMAVTEPATLCCINNMNYFERLFGVEKVKVFAEIALDDIRRSPHVLDYLLKRSKIPVTNDMLMIAVKANGIALKHIPYNRQTKEICLASLKSVRENEYYKYYDTSLHYLFEKIRPALQTDDDIIMAALSMHCNVDLLTKVEQTPARIEKAIETDTRALLYVKNPTLEMSIRAICLDPRSYRCIPAAYKTHPDIIEKAIKDRDFLLFYPDQLTPELCMRAVSANGCAVRYIKESRMPWKPRLFTREVCEEAVRQDGKNIKYIPEKYHTLELALMCSADFGLVRKDLRAKVVAALVS